jgi:farnesyl-diphosphate farnesyltransferase
MLLLPQEDINEEPAPRMFWPHEIWGQYGRSLEDFKQPGNRRAAVQCLNHLVSGSGRLLSLLASSV